MSIAPRPHYTNKTIWTTQRDLFVLDELIKVGNQGLRNDTGFTKEGWRLVTNAFNDRFLTNLEKSHIKNHIQIMKRTYEAWMRLKVYDGFRWNAETSLFEASDDVWDRFIQQNPHGRHFKTRSFFYEDRMREVFPKYGELEAERQQPPHQSTQEPSQGIVSPPMAQHADVVMNPGAGTAGLRSPSEVSAQMASHITSANLFEASPEAAGIHSGAGGYGTAHPARNGMLQTTQTSLQSPSRTAYLDQSGVANVRPTPQSSRSAPPAKRARTDGASAVPSNLTPAGRPTNVNVPGGLMIDAEALGVAVKIVTESIKQVFESTGSANSISNAGRGLSPAAGQPGSPTLIGSNTSDANVRFQSAVKLLSRMRRDLRWTKEQYKHALAVLRQLDESGVILLLEMDEDAREDFVLSEF